VLRIGRKEGKSPLVLVLVLVFCWCLGLGRVFPHPSYNKAEQCGGEAVEQLLDFPTFFHLTTSRIHCHASEDVKSLLKNLPHLSVIIQA